MLRFVCCGENRILVDHLRTTTTEDGFVAELLVRDAQGRRTGAVEAKTEDESLQRGAVAFAGRHVVT